MADRDVRRLILASASSARRAMLTAAGVAFDVVPADLDEAMLRSTIGKATAASVAELLARAKAEHVSRQHPKALVIGSDQILECDSRLFEKPRDLSGARASLLALRGRSHALHAAVAIAVGGETQWLANDTAQLTMRAFSDAFLEVYIANSGEAICFSVGAYQLEGAGIQLFERIEGDYFTILGMPLLPLLAELRRCGALER